MSLSSSASLPSVARMAPNFNKKQPAAGVTHQQQYSASTSTLNSSDDQSRRGVINMRVTANSNQGHRKYMEDCYKIRFPRDTADANNNNSGSSKTSQTATDSHSDILFSYFGIFDGHGGKEAALYCKERLFWTIVELDDFWSEDDSRILGAIREGFVKCHLDMWNELPNWPKTPSGLPSTSGTTATVLFIKKNRAYVGHVGDSGLVIGYTKQMTTNRQTSLASQWYGKKLTRDHKPEDPVELKRIESLGGAVMSKSGVNRVVWNKPLFGSSASLANTSQSCSNLNETKSQHQLTRINSASIPFKMNYLRNQTNVPYEPVPFLAVARSLGDLWSYEMKHDDFLVSPVPDVFSFELDPRIHKCLILATDGLWNMMKPSECVEYVRQTDRETERLVNRTMTSVKHQSAQPFVNPSQKLASTAVQRCSERNIRADNTTCITIMLDNPVGEDDLDYDADETLNRTCFDRLLSNKTIELTRRFNDSDEIEDAYDEIDDEDEIEDELDSTRGNRANRTTNTTLTSKRKKTSTSREPPTPKMSSTMVAEPGGELNNTPLDSDKRSRSMISLRRRHWSASSNRSASTIMPSATKPQPQQQPNKVFVNTEDRARRKLFTNVNQNVGGHQAAAVNYKLNSTEIYYRPQNQYQPLPRQQQQHSNEHHSQKSSFNRTKSSHLNQSTNMNKFSKSLRKSFNDLYSATASKLNATLNQTLHQSNPPPVTSGGPASNKSQENLKKFEKMIEEKEATLGQKYSKKLKCIKQRLVKTKNNLFGNKKATSNSTSGVNKMNPNEKNNSDQENQKAANVEQSFVSNVVKMRFLKRNRSNKIESTTGESNLNVTMSTALSAKLSNTHLGGGGNNKTKATNARQIEHYECSPNKRPKFY